MVCRRGGFIIQWHNELRDLGADMLNIVFHDVQAGETCSSGDNVLTINCWQGVRTKHRMSDWIFMPVAFGIGKVLPFSTWGLVTQTQSLTKITPFSRFMANMDMRRRGCTRKGFWKLSKELSHLCTSLLPEAWRINANISTVDKRNSYLLRKEKSIAQQFHGYLQKCPSLYYSSALLCLRRSRTTRRLPSNIEQCDFEKKKIQARFRQ